MRTINEAMFNVVSAAATVNSGATDVSNVTQCAVQAVFTDGTSAGTLKLQVSNDLTNPINWSDLSGATANVAAGATTYFKADTVIAQWLRAVWTPSAGAGTFTVRLKTSGF